MKDRFYKYVVFVLTVCMMFSEPLSVCASQLTGGFENNMQPTSEESEGADILRPENNTGSLTDGSSITESENVTEELTDGEAGTDAEGEVTEITSEISGTDSKNPDQELMRDSFGNIYVYYPKEWYKSDHGLSGTKIDSENHTLLLGRINGDKEYVPKNLYVPAETYIGDDPVPYKTQIYLGYGGSPFVGAPYGGGVLEHLWIDPGVEVLGDGNGKFGAFEGCGNLETVDMTGLDGSMLDLSKVTSFGCFFQSCESLKEVRLGKNIDNVTSLGSMFSKCRSLTSCNSIVGLSSINTSKVEDASYMFAGCTGLSSVDLSGFDLSKVTTMQGMFYGCSSLSEINLSGVNFPNITNMSGMFKDCTSLLEFEFPDTNTSKCTTIEQMFYNCPSLKTVKLDKLNTESLEDIGNLLYDDLALETLWLPTGMEKLENEGNIIHEKRGYLPKVMYCNGDEYKEGTPITSAMSGWKFQGTAMYKVVFKYPDKDFVRIVDEGEYISGPADPVWKDHVFKGWYMDSNYSQEWNYILYRVTSPLTLYPKWNQLFTVTFFPQLGSEVPSQKVEQGYTAEKPADPVRTGFTFLGWYKDEACTQQWDFYNDVVTKDLFLYAKWEFIGLDPKDIWSFSNYWDYPNGNYSMQLDNQVKDDLLDFADGSLDGKQENTNQANKNRGYINNMINNNDTGGHCLGMAKSVIANLMGYQNIASNLSSASKGQGDPIINGFHVTQCLFTDANAEKSFKNNCSTPKDRILQVISVASNISSTGPALLSYQLLGWSDNVNHRKFGGHTVVLCGMDNGIFTWRGNSYDIRLNLYDSNAFDDSTGQYNDPNHMYDIYVNSKTGEWEIPYYYEDPTQQVTVDDNGNPLYGYGLVSSYYGADITLVSIDEDIISPLTSAKKKSNTVTTNQGKLDNFVGVGSGSSLLFKNKKWNAVINCNNIVSSTIEGLTSYCFDGYAEGQPNNSPLLVYLPDDIDGDFSVQPNSDKKGEINVFLMMDQYYFSMDAKHADSIAINNDGSFTIMGNEGKIGVTLTSGTVPEGQYNTFSFSGTSIGDITLSLNATGGAEITGDDLSELNFEESDGWSQKKVKIESGQKKIELGGSEDKPNPPVRPENPGEPSNPDDPDIPDNAPEGIWIKGLKASYPYTGSAIKPEFKVYRGKTRLYLNTDYTLKYKNNTKPGTAAVTIKMKGNYSGSKDVTFKIDPASLKTDVSADTVYVAYKKNKVQKPKPELFINGAKLKYGKNDLTFTYPSEATGNGKAYVDPGTYKIHIAAKNTNMFKGEMDVDLVIAEKPLMSGVSIKANKNSIPYDNGKAVSPEYTLTYKGKAMSEGKDYTVSYTDTHTDIGKHKVTFVGNNKDYFGKKTVTFSITGKYDLTSGKAEVKLNEADLNPDGSAPFTCGGAKPGTVVKYNGVKLLAGKDYTISYTNNKNLGTATATIKGKGSYKGSVPKTFTIKARDINSISLNLSDVLYSAKKDAYKKTSVVFVDKNNKDQKLKLNKDYTLTFDGDYGSAPAAGTEIKVIVRGKGNYTGTINSFYRIIDKKFDFTKAKIVVNSGKAYDYTGSEIKPLQADLKVTLNNTALGADDYEISGYYNNIKKGNSACIKLRGKGKYAGVKFVKFKIGAAPIERLWSDTVLSLKSVFAW